MYFIIRETRFGRHPEVIFFFFKRDKLITNGEGVLKGITATGVRESCKDIFDIEVRKIGLSELMDADEVFITSTAKLSCL